MSSTLEVGDKAPAFKALAIGGAYGEGATVSLADFAGKNVVLYFYPKDDTPGCTVQACTLRDEWRAFENKAVVFGVSIDSAAKHAKFIAKYSLPFPLLVDEKKQIVSAYGVWVQKSMWGRKYVGTERSTFIIGPDGRLRAVLRNVKPKEHNAQLHAALAG